MNKNYWKSLKHFRHYSLVMLLWWLKTVQVEAENADEEEEEDRDETCDGEHCESDDDDKDYDEDEGYDDYSEVKAGS